MCVCQFLVGLVIDRCKEVLVWAMGNGSPPFWIQVVPGRAGGGSFNRKKNYIAKKEFAYRMCARWPTIAMSKLFFWVWTKLLPLHGCDVMCFGVMCLWFDLLSSDVTSCEVICGTTPVPLCTTKNYNVLLQDYSVLQSTHPVLLCTTKYYSVLQSITPVLLCTTQYYSVLHSTTPVLQSTTPVLLCTTKYRSSTTLYYTVLRQYYSSTTPVLLCTTIKNYASTTTYYSSTNLYYKVLLRYYKVLRQYYLYYKGLLQYYSVLQSTTPVLQRTTPVLQRTAQY